MNETVRIKTKRMTMRDLDGKFSIEPYVEDDSLANRVAAEGRSRVRVYTVPRPVVVLGRGSDPEGELRLEACRGDGVALQRRRGGGCAVVLDPGCVIVATALRVPGIGHSQRYFARLTTWLVAALDRLGVHDIGGDGISDLVHGDRKVAGTCIYRRKDLLLYSASLLVSPDIDAMERWLAHPPREPAYRRGRSHRAFVRPLREIGAGSARELRDGLERTLKPL